ncbi:MAG: hypothetical protein RMM28_10290 [Thermoleophilia bacterium]|nr:hypothetical protein [Gaiellaceae bacterium]MDW8339514.1 hypothetical protein [Thermoleophilia bacterium]
MATNILTAWRQAVVELLEEKFPDFTVYSGFREGQHRDMSVISVFSPGIAERAQNVQVAELRLLVRAWPKVVPAAGGERPLDPEPLEDLALRLEAALRGAQTTLASANGVWFSRLQQVQIDYEEWGCQAQLTAWADNPAVIA